MSNYYSEIEPHRKNWRTGQLLIIVLAIFMALCFSLGSVDAVGTYPAVDPNMVLYYHFNNQSSVGENATHVYDWSNNNRNNGTVIGGAIHNNTGGYLMDGAYNFDGTNDYIIANTDLINSSNSFSFCAWVYPTNLSVDFRSIVVDRTSGNAFYFEIMNTAPNNLRLEIYNSTGTNYPIYGINSLNTNEWNYPCFTVDSSSNNVSLYLNGRFENSSIVPGGFANGAGAQRIGFGQSGASRYFQGQIDETIFWNKTLSSINIWDLYRSYHGCFIPVSGLSIGSYTTILCNGTYQLNGTSSGVISFSDNDARLVCNSTILIGNHSNIQNDGSNYGIRTNAKSNVTVENCVLKNYARGVLLGNNGKDITLKNLTIDHSYNAIYLGNNMTNVNILNSSLFNHTYGVYVPAPTSTAGQGTINLNISNNFFNLSLDNPIRLRGRNTTSFRGNNYLLDGNSFQNSQEKIFIDYSDNIILRNMILTGNKTKFSHAMSFYNISNMYIYNVTSEYFHEGIYVYRGAQRLNNSYNWECTDTSSNLTIENSTFRNNDVGAWLNPINRLIIKDSLFQNNTNNVDGYNNGIFVGVCSNNINILRNNFTELMSKTIYIIGTDGVTIVNNSFDSIPLNQRFLYSGNDYWDFPTTISFESMYVSYPQANRTLPNGVNPNIQNITYLSTYKTNNVSIYGNFFDIDTQVFLITEGTTNLNTDLSDFWYRSFQFDVSFTQPTNYYISNNFNNLTHYTSGLHTIAQIDYRRSWFFQNFSISKDYLFIKNINSTGNYIDALFNLSNALFHNGTNICTGSSSNIADNDGNINITLLPSGSCYVLDNFNLTEGTTRSNSPIDFVSSTNSITITNYLSTDINVTVLITPRDSWASDSAFFGSQQCGAITQVTHNGEVLTGSEAINFCQDLIDGTVIQLNSGENSFVFVSSGITNGMLAQWMQLPSLIGLILLAIFFGIAIKVMLIIRSGESVDFDKLLMDVIIALVIGAVIVFFAVIFEVLGRISQ